MSGQFSIFTLPGRSSNQFFSHPSRCFYPNHIAYVVNCKITSYEYRQFISFELLASGWKTIIWPKAVSKILVWNSTQLCGDLFTQYFILARWKVKKKTSKLTEQFVFCEESFKLIIHSNCCKKVSHWVVLHVL